jgi:hypothetical protein
MKTQPANNIPLSFACLLALTSFARCSLQAQDIDTLAFHLYTDSLKKGVHNYISVDGRSANGRWIPLTSNEIVFSSTAGRFVGNDLVIDRSFTGEKVSFTATYNRNSKLTVTTTLYIKIIDHFEALPVDSAAAKTRKRKHRH